MNVSSIVGDNVRFVEQHQTNGSPSRHDPERFVRCIEYERAPHDYLTRARGDDTTMNEFSLIVLHPILCTIGDSPPHRRPECRPVENRGHLRIA